MKIEGWETEIYKRNGKQYGAFCKHEETGKVVYFAFRKRNHVYRDTCSTISEAVSKGKACWAIDIETLYAIRRRCVKHIGILIIDGKSEIREVFVTYTERFLDKTITKSIDRSSRFSDGCSNQRYLPFNYFKHKVIPQKIKLKSIR